MNIVLWILQVLLALMFLFHGYTMWFPSESMSQGGMAYIFAIPPTFRRFIGTAELFASVGLILPALTGILPVLTPLAAVGLVVLMLSAAIFHVPRREYPNSVFNLILLALAAFVAYGRFVLVHF